jgi:hypothetical protein
MKISRVVGVIALVSMFAPWAARAERHEYLRWVSRDRLTVEVKEGETSGEIIVGGDAIFRTEFCDMSSGYYCFFSAHHAFAVPRTFPATAREWTVQGVTFRVAARDVAVNVLGREMKGLLEIWADGYPGYGETKWRFLYSQHDGLVAFASENLRATYWLSGVTGFGASRRDSDADDPK